MRTCKLLNTVAVFCILCLYCLAKNFFEHWNSERKLFNNSIMKLKIMLMRNLLMKFQSIRSWCQPRLDNVAYPYFFLLLSIYSLDKKGKDLNLFFFD